MESIPHNSQNLNQTRPYRSNNMRLSPVGYANEFTICSRIMLLASRIWVWCNTIPIAIIGNQPDSMDMTIRDLGLILLPFVPMSENTPFPPKEYRSHHESVTHLEIYF